MRYPPIEISPYWLYEKLGDGNIIGVHGHVGPRPLGDSYVFTVTIGAPTMLAFEEDLLKGVLAHEFLHVVQHTIECHRVVESGGGEIQDHVDAEAYSASWDSYRRIDPTLQVGDPVRWLGEELLRLAERLDDANDPRLRAAMEKIKSDWISKGLPVVEFVGTTKGRGLTLSNAIIKKARAMQNEPQDNIDDLLLGLTEKALWEGTDEDFAAYVRDAFGIPASITTPRDRRGAGPRWRSEVRPVPSCSL
jgi:hypothetical protein